MEIEIQSSFMPWQVQEREKNSIPTIDHEEKSLEQPVQIRGVLAAI